MCSRKKSGPIPQIWANSVEIKISTKMSKIPILRKWLVFKNFDLLHEAWDSQNVMLFHIYNKEYNIKACFKNRKIALKLW